LVAATALSGVMAFGSAFMMPVFSAALGSEHHFNRLSHEQDVENPQ
jgi:hypothetical protein